MNAAEIKETLRLHRAWWLNEKNGKRADLSSAVLRGANLTGANLTGANLIGAYLSDADLTGANLEGANLTGANLEGANLTDANLTDANLTDADLRGANLTGANLPDGVPIISNIDAAILAAIEAGGTLDMKDWHKCETTHCRAGWAVHLAGDAGYALEDRFLASTAGALIYAASRPDKPIPNFYASNEDAMADMRQCAAE